jgi:hypothetical protein
LLVDEVLIVVLLPWWLVSHHGRGRASEPDVRTVGVG